MKITNQIDAILVVACLCLGFLCYSGCAGNSSVVKEQPQLAASPYYPVNWYYAELNTWQLISLEKNGERINLYGEGHEVDKTSELYIMRFSLAENEKKILYGKGAPNTYWGAIDFGDDSTIGIGCIASTKIAPYLDIETIAECDYFKYLEKAQRWALNADGNLLLFSQDSEEKKVMLIFEKMASRQLNRERKTGESTPGLKRPATRQYVCCHTAF